MHGLSQKHTKMLEDWNFLTERLRQRRVRFRAIFTREIVAWLVLQANRYNHTAQAAREKHRDDSDPWVQNVIAKMKDRAEHCYALITQLADNWGSVEWWDAIAQVEAVLKAGKEGDEQAAAAATPPTGE